MKFQLKSIPFIICCCVFFTAMTSCRKDERQLIENNVELPVNLSGYGIFRGTLSDLDPAPGFHLYELATPLFSDYSEKQRLIRLPAGTSMTADGDGLPQFPEGTMIVKTFFYYNDKRDVSQGKKIMETRILLKHDSKWNVGTYIWNPQQTEATLYTAGMSKVVNWIDGNGSGKVISYHVPSNMECVSCHRSDNAIMPIGPKLRNLNMNVIRNSGSVNQLQYFSDSSLINHVDPASIEVLPGWQDPAYSVSERARAYLDVNCAHCHNTKGFALEANLALGYEVPFTDTHIEQKGDDMIHLMENGRMPYIGTTVVDAEGLALIRSYIESL